MENDLVTFNYDVSGDICHDTFYFLFEGKTFEKLNRFKIIDLFVESWKFGIKAAGEPKKMWEKNYVEEYGSYVTDPSGETIQLENVWFSGFCGDNLNIQVKVGDRWETIYDVSWGRGGWQYPIETGAIQEILRFLKALADTVQLGRKREYKAQKIIEKEENNRRFQEYTKRKTKLDSFKISV